MTDAADADVEEEPEDPAELDPLGEELVARVAAADEALAGAVGDLQDRVVDLEAELADREERIEELESSLKRTQADFQNYKRRAEERREELEERATEDLLERLLDVRDNLVRALEQDANTDIRDGVEVTLNAFDRVLEEEDVEPIDPEPGTETDPHRHQAMQRVESDEPEGTVVDVYRPGYAMAGTVLRPAQVTVSEGDDDAAEADDAGDTDEE